MDKRDPFDDLGETLGGLMARHEAATSDQPGDRGRRRRPRYRSEEQRTKLTIDVDLEPAVIEAVRRLAAAPPADYGDGQIRPGDLAVVALILGLLAISEGQADFTAEWTARSHGRRNCVLVDDLEARWDILVQALGIDRFPE